MRPLLFLIVLMCSAHISRSQIKAELTNLPKGPVETGSTQTIVYNVVNQGDDTVTLNFSRKIPSPLKALVFTSSITVLPNSTRNILIPVSVPNHAKAGNYELEFSLLKKGETITSSKIIFEVPRRTDINVDLISRPTFVRSDDTVRAQFIISNHGNDRELMTIFSRNCKIPGAAQLNIPPDSSAFVEVELIPDKTLFRIDDKAIDLSAHVLSIDRVFSDQEIIRIYPTKTKKIDPYFRFPIYVNSSYIRRYSNGEQKLNTYQIQVTGKGSLDPNKKHNLIFEYRGPGSVRVTRLGNFAQKYVQYYNKKFDVFVGEKTFSLSNLTENYRFGSGLQINAVVLPGLKIGSYYNRPLLQPDIDRQISGYAIYETKRKYTYRINSIVNDLHDSGYLNLSSVQMSWSDFNKWSFSTELSRSFGTGKQGNAYSFSGSYDFERLKVSGSGLYADQNFKGYYNNSLYLNGNLGYNFHKIGIQLGGNMTNESPHLDTVYSAAPYSIYLNSGLVGRFTKSWNLQLLALYRQKVDRLSDKRFDYEERRLRFASTYRSGHWSGRFLSEGGITRNLLIADSTHQTAFGFDAQTQATYTPNGKFTINAFIQYLNNIRFTESRFQYFLYGMDISWRLHQKLSLEFEFQNNYLVEDLYNDRNLMNMAFSYQIKESHRLNVAANYGILHQPTIRRDWYFNAAYSFKIGVPLKKMLSLGSVKGQILNGGVNSISKIVLMMDGQLVTTDETGNFKFNNIRPGEHQLFIDKRSVEVRDMPDTTMPITVVVQPDMTSFITFKMTRSGSVKGKVEMLKVKTIQSSKENVTLPRVIVEASNGTEQFLTQTNSEGEFLFGSLRPGEWKIRLVPTYWKDQFIIKVGEETVMVSPDGTTEVLLTIQPKVRQIKFLQQTPIKIGGE
ncbi:MAG: hypothetical protein GC181_00205 [Bacteroidetes bacterium]|nr:hypothetical protein [Bacteroidota bacterium]